MLTPFRYSDHEVRVVTIGGEPWFVLTDLCKVLDLSTPARVAERLDPAAVSQTHISSGGQRRQVTIVSESGMYEVVIRSDKPEAVAFRRWITSDVLPAIRKTGNYSVTPTLSPDEIVHQALQITAQRVETLTARLALVEPKAAAFDRWLSSNVDYAVGHVSNALSVAGVPDMGRNRLFAYLQQAKWAYRADGQWTPYQTAIDTGRLAVKLGSQLNTRTGEQFRTVTLRITPKGAAKLAILLGVMPEAVADALAADESESAA